MSTSSLASNLTIWQKDLDTPNCLILQTFMGNTHAKFLLDLFQSGGLLLYPQWLQNTSSSPFSKGTRKWPVAWNGLTLDQPAITSSKLTIEALEKGKKYVQS